MASQVLSSLAGGTLELDICYRCHGIWFDPQENLKLAPAAVVELFRLLHAHRVDERHPLNAKLKCPRCHGQLAPGFDVVRSGRYNTYRCPQRHGRFSAFSSFMIEKGFVRQLTAPEIDSLALRVAAIHCTSCGAPVDIRKDHACPHCRSAFSLIDPMAVERAMQGYAKAVKAPPEARPADLADALMMMERDRLTAERAAKARRGIAFTSEPPTSVDLWAAGVAVVFEMLR